MALSYYTGQLSIGVGNKDASVDVQPDNAREGYGWVLRDLEMIFNQSGDTANVFITYWLSVLAAGRFGYVPFTEGFAGDLLGVRIQEDAKGGYGSVKFEQEGLGVVIVDPVFQDRITLGLSGVQTTAGVPVTLSYRMAIEPVKLTNELLNQLYQRQGS